jgi:dihydroorotate dehydrogenase (NAD+) catalytic subunit
MQTPFYDPTKTYDENYTVGPFGAFADGEVFPDRGEPKYELLGFKVHMPFGIPAGPLLNSAYMKGALEKWFDLPVYKTVRSDVFPCHPFPNVLAVHPEGDLTFEEAKTTPLVTDTDYRAPLSITNSFGVPSKAVPVWQEDFKRAQSFEGEGQVSILSFMGTVRKGQTHDEFVADYIDAGRKAAETGAKILEVNLSCPNIGNEGLVCYDLSTTEEVCKGLRAAIGKTPLLLKVGYYESNDDIARLAEIAARYAQGVAAINTIQAAVIDAQGNQALPGENRARSGICGASIKWAGLSMTERLAKARSRAGASFAVVGVGGVTVAKDFQEYRSAGADAVMSATGAMWNPYLAREIWEITRV